MNLISKLWAKINPLLGTSLLFKSYSKIRLIKQLDTCIELLYDTFITQAKFYNNERVPQEIQQYLNY